MGISIWQILIVAVLIVLLFGRGRISDLMGDLGKGITSFRAGLKDSANESEDKPTTSLEDKSGETIDVPSKTKEKATQS